MKPGEKRTQKAALMVAVAYIWSSVGCRAEQAIDLPQPEVRSQQYTQTPTITATATMTPTPLITTTPLPTITPTPNPYAAYYVTALAARTYGGGVLQSEGLLDNGSAFTRSLFKYRSEGLDLYGFMNVPNGSGPFPVIILLHGYVEQAEYNTLAYSTRYADTLAEAGYLVLHPNLRGYANSDQGDNPVGIGDSIDILNLVALVRSQAGVPGPLQKADGECIGLWGHSMGGGIALRVMVVGEEIKAALLYAPIHADEEVNLQYFEFDGRGNPKIDAPPEVLQGISPVYYLDRISAALSIHHGTQDRVVPATWSEQLCRDLGLLKKEVLCFFYEDQPHTFKNNSDTLFIQRSIEFFDKYLR